MTNKDLQKYAVYKSTSTPWSQEEYEVVSNLMGDQDTLELAKSTSTRKFIYTSDNGSYFLHYDQNTVGKTIITLVDFLGLVDYKNLALSAKKGTYWTFQQLETIANLTGLRRAGPELEHNVTSKDYAYYVKTRDGFYCWRDQNITKVEKEKITFPYTLLEELVDLKKPKNLCSEIATPDSYKLRPGLELLDSMLTPSGIFEGFTTRSEPVTLKHGKTVAIDSLMKILGEKTMTSKNKISASAHLLAMAKFMGSGVEFGNGSYPKGKYLSLSVKNGQSNVKSLIHQAMYTGIKDPRPYIKDLIQRELNRLTTDVSTINLENIDYGFNIKLASQVAYFKGLKAALAKNEITSMDTQDAVNFYNFKKELASYEKARTANENVCPYSWISNHLKSEVLDRPGLHSLFVSNNIVILAKDGKLSFESMKEGKKYSVNIKLNVATGLYSI